MIKYSIIVPVYNVEKYLSNCLDSLLNNQREDFEVVLVNDGSKDASLGICETYAEKDKRILLIDQHNKGVSGARNTGLKHATGRYVLFVDSDDWVEKDYLSILDASVDAVSDIVVFGYDNINDTTEATNSFILWDDTFCNSEIGKAVVKLDGIGYLFNVPWNKLYRREKLKGFFFQEGLSYCEDLEFNSRVFCAISQVKFSKNRYYKYRSSDSSLTNNRYYPNYKELANIAITARENVYKFYSQLENSSLLILQRKEVKYRLGTISNLYRPNSTKDRSQRILELFEIRSHLENLKKTRHFLNLAERIEFDSLYYLGVSVADFILCNLFKIKNKKLISK